MRVLSIDLDYIMSPTIEDYSGVLHHNNPTIRWDRFFSEYDLKESNFYIDKSNLLFCYNLFLKCLKTCDNVSFGYDHDSILFSISNYNNIDLINIDHHDDIFGGDYIGNDDLSSEDAYKRELYEILNHDRVHEGNWGAWLAVHNKIKSFTWIGNKNSANKKRNELNAKIVPNYLNVEKENYKFDNYKFDHIFVCMSPPYIPPNCWHYFPIFISAYEEFSGKDAIIHTEKYETHVRYQRLHNEILHQCSDGRRPLPSEGLREWKALRK